MTNAMQHLNYNETEIRTVLLDGETWWIAKDVGDVLGLSNVRELLRSLDHDEKAAVRIPDTSSAGVTQNRELNIVNEPGLYALIRSSTKPEAKAFDRWLRWEVLPQVNRKGFYIGKAATQRTRELASLEFRAQATRARIEADDWERKAQQVFEIEGAVPLMDWIQQHRSDLNTKQAANLSRTLKQVIAQELDKPVTNMSVPRRGKRLCARPEDIASAMDTLNNRMQLELI